MDQEKINEIIREHTTCIETTFSLQAQAVTDFSHRVVEAFHRGNRLLALGGGSLAPVAELIANLFLYRLGFERPQLPAVALGGNRGLAHALGRDGQYRQYYARQVRMLAIEGDVLVAVSDGHRDDALVEGLQAARQAGVFTALVLPARADWSEEPPDLSFPIETDSTARFGEAVLFFGHLLCQLVEAELFGI